MNQVVEIEGFTDISRVLRSGVYILAHKGVVIYIGQSKRMLARIYAHRSMWRQKARGKRSPDWMPIKGILFDEVFICPCPLDKLDQFEIEMINLYKPKFNTRLKAAGQIEAPFTLKVNGFDLPMNQTTARPRPNIERRI